MAYQSFLSSIDKGTDGLTITEMHHAFPLKRSRFNILVRELEDAGLIESDTPLQNRKERHKLERPGNFKLTAFGRQYLDKCKELDELTQKAKGHALKVSNYG